jgi:hypothetical protein
MGNDAPLLRCAVRYATYPEYNYGYYGDIGFRCVRR